jgi:predicted PurR-regulated permease PerM
VGLAFWGWLWGLPGLLLAVPLLMIFKAVGDHVEALRPVVTLLKASAPSKSRHDDEAVSV